VPLQVPLQVLIQRVPLQVPLQVLLHRVLLQRVQVLLQRVQVLLQRVLLQVRRQMLVHALISPVVEHWLLPELLAIWPELRLVLLVLTVDVQLEIYQEVHPASVQQPRQHFV